MNTDLSLGIRLPEDGFDGFHSGFLRLCMSTETVLCSKVSPENSPSRLIDCARREDGIWLSKVRFTAGCLFLLVLGSRINRV